MRRKGIIRNEEYYLVGLERTMIPLHSQSDGLVIQVILTRMKVEQKLS